MNPCGRGFLYEPRLNKTGANFSAFSMVFFLVGWLEQESRKLSRVNSNNNKGQSLPSCGPQAAQSEQGLALLGLSRVDLALLGPPGEQESRKLSRVNKQASKQGSVPTELRAPGGPE